MTAPTKYIKVHYRGNQDKPAAYVNIEKIEAIYSGVDVPGCTISYPAHNNGGFSAVESAEEVLVLIAKAMNHGT